MRPKFAKESTSHRFWDSMVLMSSPSDDSDALDSELDSFGSGSLSESDRIGIFFGGAGIDRGGESDIPA